MSSIHVMNWRNRTKRKLIEYKGGKCEMCGYDKIEYARAFSFHHLDSNQKDFGVSGKSWSFERLKSETDKCQLLCVRCHAELHDKQEAEDRNKRMKIRANRLTVKKCRECNNDFKPTHYRQRFCSEKCAHLSLRRVKRPSKPQLAEDIAKLSWTAIGKKYEVSDNACRKWARKMGLIV